MSPRRNSNNGFVAILGAFLLLVVIVVGMTLFSGGGSARGVAPVATSLPTRADLAAIQQEATDAATMTAEPAMTVEPATTMTSPATSSEVTPVSTPALHSKILVLGRRCVDHITNDSQIFAHEATNLALTLESPTVIASIYETEGKYYPKLDYRYIGDEWLSIDELIFNADGEVIRLETYNQDIDLDGNQSIETGLAPLLEDDIAALEKLAHSQNLRVRFQGTDGFQDITVTDNELTTIRFAYDAYTELSSGSLSFRDFRLGCPG